MKKVLMFVIVMLMLFIGCSGEEPVLPEEPKEPEVLEMPTPVETVTCKQAVLDIAALLGQNEEAEDYVTYADQHGLTTYMYDVDWNDPISYRDAAALLYAAAEHYLDRLPMAVVTEAHPEIDGIDDDSARYILFMYRWGILYGDAPEDWYASISPDGFSEMLLRFTTPELRLELLPDMLTQLSWKLDAVFPCACMREYTEEELQTAKEGLYTVLAEWEGLQRALEYSYWILEKNDGIFYLNMFTGMEDGTISFTRCTYDPATEQGEISDLRTPVGWETYGSEREMVYAVCMTEEKKELLEGGLAHKLLQKAQSNGWDLRGYTVAYAMPRWEDPGMVLISMEEGELSSEAFCQVGGLAMHYSDQMAHSWYQRLSSDFSVGLDKLRAATEEVLSENLRQKAMETTFCSCMARAYAQWRVYGDAEFVPVVRAVFADYVAEHGNRLVLKYGDLLKNTYWLIDRDLEGTYYLQIIGFGEESAEQRLMLTYDGSDITVYEGPKTLTGLVYSVCADSCTEDNRKAAEDRYNDRDQYDEQFYWRLSAIEEGECVLTRFGVPRTYGHPSTFARWVEAEYPAWHWGQRLDEELTVTEDRTDGMATMLDQVLAMDFSVLELGEDEIFLLDYLKVSLTNENDLGRWNLPAAVCGRSEEFVWVRSSIHNFLKELELDPAMKECFANMDRWTWKDLGDNKYSISGVDSSGRKWEAWMKTVHFVDMEGWVTPSRKHMLELAEAGDNSELIPEETRDRFVTFALLDSSFSYDLAGKGGSAHWIWSITENGKVRLEVHSVHDEIKKYNKTYQYDTIILEEVDGSVINEEYIYGR